MIKCMLCDQEFKRITWKHLYYKHDLTLAQYRAMGGRIGNEKICLTCGNEFVPGHRKQKCCGTDCSYEYRSRTYRGKNHYRYGTRFSHTEETKRKISRNSARYWKGKKRPQVGQKIAAKLKGRPNLALKGRKFPGRKNEGQFKQGQKAWNEGQTMPPEYGEKVRQAMIEKGAIRYGPDNPAWKGGITPEMQKLRKSKQYAEWRQAVFKRDAYTCQVCGQVGGNIVAHHIKRWANYPEYRFDVANGLTMCRPCHSSLHARGYSDWGTIAEVRSRIIGA